MLPHHWSMVLKRFQTVSSHISSFETVLRITHGVSSLHSSQFTRLGLCYGHRLTMMQHIRTITRCLPRTSRHARTFGAFNKTLFHEPDPSKPKLVLAYSGGLDTSTQLAWLVNEKGFEVCAYIAGKLKCMQIGSMLCLYIRYQKSSLLFVIQYSSPLIRSWAR